MLCEPNSGSHISLKTWLTMPSILLGCCTTDHALPVGQGCRTHRSSTCKPHSHTLICAESSRPFLPVKLISSGLATCSLQPFSCQSRADASSSGSKGGQSTLSSAGKIPYRHMLRHHVSWHSARWGSPYWRTIISQSHSRWRWFSWITWTTL